MPRLSNLDKLKRTAFTLLDNVKNKLDYRTVAAYQRKINDKDRKDTIQKIIDELTVIPDLEINRKISKKDIPTKELLQEKKIKNVVDRFNANKINSFKVDIQNKNQFVLLLNGLRDKFAIINLNNVIYTLSRNTINRLINTDYNVEIVEGSGSDAEIMIYVRDFGNVSISRSIPSRTLLISGAFFPYTHNTDLVLTDFQIMSEFSADGVIENCLTQALISAEVEEHKIMQLKAMSLSRDIPQSKLDKIAEELELYISVVRPEANDAKRHYGNKTNKEVQLGLIDNHYFHIKQVPITQFAIDNYNELKDIDRYNEIYKIRDGKYYKRDAKRFINSYNLILSLKRLNLLSPLEQNEELYKTIYYNKIDNITNLHYDDKNVVLNEFNPKKESDFINVFFDFETTTNGDKHVSYMCCIADDDKTFYGEHAGRNMLYHVAKKYKYQNIRLIAHNAGYDLRFIFNCLSQPEIIERGKMLLRAYGLFFYEKKKYIKIEIQDSYSLIPSKLSGFTDIFKIEQKKEILPYSLYTETNVMKRYIPLEECISHCNDPEYLTNINEWKCIDNGIVDIIRYSEIYCKMDCEVLKTGYNIFKKWISDICNLNLDNYVSVASLANDFMSSKDVYEDVYKLSNIPREFIQKTMVGGRCMVSNNTKKTINKSMNDFDAVSLYPSAMKRLGGYLIGKPKVLSNLTYDFLQKCDGYFVEIVINSVGIQRTFPLMSYKTNDGIRLWTNETIDKTLFVDKIQLEDLIQFQKVEFEIIRGYYYDEGRNPVLEETICYLFDERVKAKKVKNPIQETYKLLMNSSYGKTLLKAFEDDTEYITQTKYNEYVARHYNSIKEIIQVNDFTYKIKRDISISTHFNNAHCGVEVLSMSKRIMNEVMCLAEDNGIDIYYQDTDSMHIQDADIFKLRNLFNDKYNRELIGKGMGQFHSDFSSQLLKENIISKRGIFLGKKCYIDELTDETGNIDYHIRMKGISNDSILYYCKQNEITPFELYEKLFAGEAIQFDLLNGGTKVNFVFNKNMTIKNNTDFKRTIHF